MTIGNAYSIRTAVSDASIKQPTKRNRTQLSCTHCRHAKLKCDREKPCSQCVKRGRSFLCTFPPSAVRKRPAASMKTRLKHLENLVKGAMASQPSDEPNSQLQDQAAGRVVDATYVGATHWAAMLDDIEEVKGFFSKYGEEPLGDENMRSDTSLLFNNKTTFDDMVAALPDRNVVNRLVSRYFNSNSPALHIIHKHTFQRNYRKFWDDPRSSPINFLALIFAIMCLGIFAALGADEEIIDATGSTPTEMIRVYRGCCAQCLTLSNYAKHPGPYTLETFLIYIECEFVLSQGDQMSCYLIVGIAVRLALRMGLHRDPDKLGGNITPYQGEMRRRIWHLLVQMDLLVSFHNGLPSMVQAVKSDTRIPLNLQDQDFDEESTKLPSSRPETEITVMSYTLAKGRLANVFGKIVEQVNLLTAPHYAEVTALDRELELAFSAVPPFLRAVPIDLCITEPAELIIRRLSLAVLFLKSRCILHRKYLMKEKDSVEFSYSKKAAIDASRELLQIQSEVHNAAQPGGVLSKDLWVISSLVMHDLLLAAMILYLCLVQESVTLSTTVEGQKLPNTRHTEMIAALERSYRVWFETKSMSLDTRKAYGVLDNILKRLNSIFWRQSVETNGNTGAHEGSAYDTKEITSGLSSSVPRPDNSDGALGDVVTGQHEVLGESTPCSNFTVQPNFDYGILPVDGIAEITDISMNFDWDVFDSHLRQTRVNDQSWPDISFQDFHSGEGSDEFLI